LHHSITVSERKPGIDGWTLLRPMKSRQRMILIMGAAGKEVKAFGVKGTDSKRIEAFI